MTLPSPLRIAAAVAALVALAPLVAVAVTASGPGADSLTWATFARYAWTSAALAAMVGIGAGLLGGFAAWLVALNDFPGRRIFAWALVLPLAAPAFVLAYGYADLFDVAGPIRTAWRGWFGYDPPFDMRSIWGAARWTSSANCVKAHAISRPTSCRATSVPCIASSISAFCRMWRPMW